MHLQFVVDRFQWMLQFTSALQQAGILQYSVSTDDPNYSEDDRISYPLEQTRGWVVTLFTMVSYDENVALFIFRQVREDWHGDEPVLD